MRKAEALRLKPGDSILFTTDPAESPRAIRRADAWHVAKVVTVTPRGGILVDVLHQEHWTGQVVSRQWVPYHHCALYAVEQG